MNTSPPHLGLKLFEAARAKGDDGKLPVMSCVRVKAAITPGAEAAALAATSSALGA